MPNKDGIYVELELTALYEPFRKDPYPILDAMREKDPMHRDPMLNRWFVSRHDSVRQILRDKSFLVDQRNLGQPFPERADWEVEMEPEPRDPSMLSLDEPDHRRLRSIVSKAFTPRAVEDFRPRIAEIVDDVMAQFDGSDEVDLIAAFAGPIPTVVIAEMLGVDPADQAQFKSWSDQTVKSFNPILAEEERKAVLRASVDLRSYFDQEVARRKSAPNPPDDLLTAMVRAEEEGERLTEREIATMGELLIVAGNVTTTDLIGNGMLALLEHPEQIQKLRNNPDLIVNAVEEMLRYDSPIVETRRLASKPVTLDGEAISRGDAFSPSLAAANHDPAVYPNPHAFDIEREDTHHHSFGGGIHHCIGAPLARAEAQIAIGALLARYPDIELARPVNRRNVPVMQGCEALWVKLCG